MIGFYIFVFIVGILALFADTVFVQISVSHEHGILRRVRRDTWEWLWLRKGR